MKDFLVLFREEDGRTVEHAPEEISRHQANWRRWMENISKQVSGGKPLTLRGKVIRDFGKQVIDGPYTPVAREIVGGYLLVRAESLDAAAELVKSCPVFEFDGFAEVRELM